jgi:hypothetical protein
MSITFNPKVLNDSCLIAVNLLHEFQHVRQNIQAAKCWNDQLRSTGYQDFNFLNDDTNRRTEINAYANEARVIERACRSNDAALHANQCLAWWQVQQRTGVEPFPGTKICK